MHHPLIAKVIEHVRNNAAGGMLPAGLTVTLNFHPDALWQGRPVIDRLADDGIYHSQFETGISNGGLTATPGGDRWRWESRIFGGHYDSADPTMRPKYGALNYLNRATGGSPRFGSAHLRLRSHVLSRTSFCYPDSFLNPVHFAVADRFNLIAEAERRNSSMDPLDRYIEAHVHGPLLLADDVEAIVLDPCYRHTEVEAIARALPCTLSWHPGFRMPISRIPQCICYRGRDIADLAASLAIDGHLTPRDIGLALRANEADVQKLKRVWHCVARFGSPEA